MAKSFDEITTSIQKFKSNLQNNLENTTFDWRLKIDDIFDEAQEQCIRHENGEEVAINNGWAIALASVQRALCKLASHYVPLSTTKELMKIVDRRYLTLEWGIYDIRNAEPPMINEGFIKKMLIHHSFRGYNQNEHDSFEAFIIDLLVKGPVVISFDVFPSYAADYIGTGIFCPTDIECEARKYEKFSTYVVLLTGYGVKMQGNEAIEYWIIKKQWEKNLDTMVSHN